MNKRKLKILTLALVVCLISLVTFLSLKNYRSEVTIDLKVDGITFTAIEGKENAFLSSLEFLSNIIVDSLKLENCNIKFKPEKFMEFDHPGEVTVERNDLSVSASNPLIFKDFNVPKNSIITLTHGEKYILLEVYSDHPELDIITGSIGLSSNNDFFLEGSDIKLDIYPDKLQGNKRMRVKQSPLFKNIPFTSKRKFSAKLYTHQDEKDILLRDITVNNIKTTMVNRVLERYEESTLQQAHIAFMGESFLRKKFLLDDYSLNDGDFLEINEKDKYLLRKIEIDNEGLNMAVFGEKVKGLGAGKTQNTIASISPTKLEFLFAEPFKNMLWSIAVLLLGPEFVFLFWNPIKNFLLGRHEKDHLVPGN